jgi:hypothetical protein
MKDASFFIRPYVPEGAFMDKFAFFYGRNGTDYMDGVFNMYTGAGNVRYCRYRIVFLELTLLNTLWYLKHFFGSGSASNFPSCIRIRILLGAFVLSIIHYARYGVVMKSFSKAKFLQCDCNFFYFVPTGIPQTS